MQVHFNTNQLLARLKTVNDCNKLFRFIPFEDFIVTKFFPGNHIEGKHMELFPENDTFYGLF